VLYLPIRGQSLRTLQIQLKNKAGHHAKLPRILYVITPTFSVMNLYHTNLGLGPDQDTDGVFDESDDGTGMLLASDEEFLESDVDVPATDDLLVESDVESEYHPTCPTPPRPGVSRIDLAICWTLFLIGAGSACDTNYVCKQRW
jgi:hypothetical protein